MSEGRNLDMGALYRHDMKEMRWMMNLQAKLPGVHVARTFLKVNKEMQRKERKER